MFNNLSAQIHLDSSIFYFSFRPKTLSDRSDVIKLLEVNTSDEIGKENEKINNDKIQHEKRPKISMINFLGNKRREQ